MIHEYKDEPICPSCLEEVGIDENELYHLYDSDDDHEIECPHCEEIFFVHPVATYTFSTNIINDF